MVYGPYFFDCSVDNVNYLSMLENHFWQQHLKTKHKEFYYFHQDEEPEHKHINVQSWLNSKFGDKLFDKDLCLPRSPDLNQRD